MTFPAGCWLGFLHRGRSPAPCLQPLGARPGAPDPEEPLNQSSHPNAGTPAGYNVVIAGGGFGGLYTALALARQRNHPPILLIEPNERFLFLPLLYELLSGELRAWEIAPRYDELLAGSGVAWLRDRVDSIDAPAARLETHAGQRISYGRLVLATGARSFTYGVPGADEHCLGFRSLADVERLQQLVAQLTGNRQPLQRVAVIGAGPTGVELACKLADMVAGAAVIELIEKGDTALPQSRSFNREQALRALQKRDVRLHTQAEVTAVAADTITLRRRPVDGRAAEEERLRVSAVVWTAGIRCLPPKISPEPASDSIGRLLCEADLRLEGDDHIFVAGDLARHAVSPAPGNGEPPPASAQVAFQQASQLALNISRSLAGSPTEPFLWRDLGEMMSLGKGEASLCAAGFTLAGPAAYRLRRLAYLSRLPGLPHQLRVAAGWLADTLP